MKFRPALACALILAATLAGCSDTGSESAPVEEAEASPEPAAFYVGRWAADPAWCTDQSEGFPITITQAHFEGRENVCEMSDIEDTPEGGVTARLSCQSLGETLEESIAFAPAGEQMAITYLDRGGDPILFSRCAEQ